MQIVHVRIEVLPEYIESFREATVSNARESRKEPGVIRFELYQEEAAPSSFLLVEIYRDRNAPVHHKGTAHYTIWRDTVEPMMARPRSSTRYVDLFPTHMG